MSEQRSAGKALDVEVAVKILGLLPDGELLRHPTEGFAYADVHSFSTDIRHAFTVVEAMRAKGWGITMANDAADGSWAVALDYPGVDDVEATADTAALCICIASLNALAALPPSEKPNE